MNTYIIGEDNFARVAQGEPAIFLGMRDDLPIAAYEAIGWRSGHVFIDHETTRQVWGREYPVYEILSPAEYDQKYVHPMTETPEPVREPAPV